MKSWFNRLIKLFLTVVNSIGFRPAIISFWFLVASVGIVWAEQAYPVQQLTQSLAFWMFEDKSNTVSLLNAVLTGMISLTVFSFSMVMVVLSQAASSFSPRVIPQVITEPVYQNTLGLYIGTIIYALILRLGIQADAASSSVTVPRLGLALCMVLVVVCLGVFIFFIHTVSQSIRVDYMVEKLYRSTLKELQEDLDNHVPAEATEPDSTGWVTLPFPDSGYYRGFRTKRLVELTAAHDLQLKVLPTEGTFLVKGYPFLRVSRDIRQEEDVREAVMQQFVSYDNEYLRDSALHGFKRLMEIAIRALSPSTNDPETAIKVIHYLTDLFAHQMAARNAHLYLDDTATVRIVRTDPDLDEMFLRYLTPIRHYGKEDVVVLTTLLKAYRQLLFSDLERRHTAPLLHHIQATLFDADAHLDNPLDREAVNGEVRYLNALLIDTQLPELSAEQQPSGGSWAL
ncbi:Uncharacterized membrane protein [Catalinimonas alkaloidigena]|uniref:Uncharacterized membrane protein n=1 Tax=Catalinimonas alkaloidigena TaxID=1075417 RepID=A0A1G9UEJ8_9BACT|nr:DUF2254 domain-containing protein [Catalinimonas alkaloidigena]SDM58370.1 Uncharacterized membrane protein [Catalinimonas alkaloidigena]